MCDCMVTIDDFLSFLSIIYWLNEALWLFLKYIFDTWSSTISNSVLQPAEFKHINKQRKRKQ